MGYYHLFEFATDQASLGLWRIDQVENVGYLLMQEIEDSYYNTMGLDNKNKPAPTPRDIIVNDAKVATFLGSHYDGSATGYNAAIPFISPYHIAVTIPESAIDNLKHLTQQTVNTMLTSFLSNFDQSETEFEVLENIVTRADQAGIDYIAERPDTIIPVLYNDTPHYFPLRVLKKWAFSPGDEQFFYFAAGYPFNFNEGFIQHTKASEISNSNDQHFKFEL